MAAAGRVEAPVTMTGFGTEVWTWGLAASRASQREAGGYGGRVGRGHGGAPEVTEARHTRLRPRGH